MDSRNHFSILALDGGGTRGIYSAQVLAKLEDKIGAPIQDCFDLIAGTSTGAIVAGAAVTGTPLAKVVELFEKQASRIFPRKRLRWGLFGSRYSQGPLEDTLRAFLPDTTLGNISTPLIITSSNISTGGVQVFKSRYLADLNLPYVRDGDIPLIEAILASSAAPIYFDPVYAGDSLLADGGLWANNPSILAVTEAVSKFQRSLDQIHVLSIGTGHPIKMYGHGSSWGILTGWGRTKLVSYFLNLQSQSSTNMAKLLLGSRYVRLDPEIEDWGLDSTEPLGNLKALATDNFTRRSEDILKSTRRQHMKL